MDAGRAGPPSDGYDLVDADDTALSDNTSFSARRVAAYREVA